MGEITFNLKYFLYSYIFQGQFYSRSSVCVSLHITEEATPGWEYSVAIFHGLNFFTFVFILLAYSYMYNIIKVWRFYLLNFCTWEHST